MKSILTLVFCAMVLSACGSASQQSAQYASWDNMYYYDPYTSAE